MTRILVAEDEPGIASFIVKGLTANGYAATVAADGEHALWQAQSGEFDLVVLDLGLPGRDGLSIVHQLRREKNGIPVVILTAREGVESLVAGLDAGADDYIAKPFRFDELLARIRSRLRTGHTPEETTMRFRDIVFDLKGRRVERDGQPVELTAREYVLLMTFLDHPGQVLSRQQLLSHVWGYDFEGGSNVVDVYVSYLRRKLGSDLIVTVRGLGYRLGDPDPG
jgi:two-component system copper resistance phosphate regulon response regulator CusR